MRKIIHALEYCSAPPPLKTVVRSLLLLPIAQVKKIRATLSFNEKANKIQSGLACVARVPVQRAFSAL